MDDNKLYTNILAVVSEAYEAEDLDFDDENALVWGKDFTWPLEVGTRDTVRLYQHMMDLRSMTADQHRIASLDRLSIDRIERCVCKNNPDFERIKDLAGGMRILTSNDFKPNNKPPPLIKLYVKLAGAVNKMIYFDI